MSSSAWPPSSLLLRRLVPLGIGVPPLTVTTAAATLANAAHPPRHRRPLFRRNQAVTSRSRQPTTARTDTRLASDSLTNAASKNRIANNSVSTNPISVVPNPPARGCRVRHCARDCPSPRPTVRRTYRHPLLNIPLLCLRGRPPFPRGEGGEIEVRSPSFTRPRPGPSVSMEQLYSKYSSQPTGQ